MTKNKLIHEQKIQLTMQIILKKIIIRCQTYKQGLGYLQD